MQYTFTHKQFSSSAVHIFTQTVHRKKIKDRKNNTKIFGTIEFLFSSRLQNFGGEP
jgi:hypothetical protein